MLEIWFKNYCKQQQILENRENIFHDKFKFHPKELPLENDEVILNETDRDKTLVILEMT